MKILFITDLYPVKNNERTTPRTLSNFVYDWREAGHEVDVIKPNFTLNSFLRGKPFYRQGNYDGVLNLNYWTPFWFDVKKKIVSLHANPSPAGQGKCFKNNHDVNITKTGYETGLPSCPSALLPSDYDLIIAHMPSGILFADKLGVPFVAGIHNSDLTVLTSPLYEIYFKKRMEKALENAKAIACRSFVLKENFLKLYPQFKEKTFAAPSGINVDLISLPSCPHDFMPSKTKILTCANYKKRKNIEKVLQALNGLEGFELTVTGQGTDTKKLRKLNPQAIFKGWLPQKKVLEIMKNSDIFILPSTGETFGMVYLEAMASGCVTICTEGDGIDGIIKNKENGFTVKPDVNEIRKLLLDIKNLDFESLKVLQQKSFETVKQYNRKSCSENYLQQIFKIM